MNVIKTLDSAKLKKNDELQFETAGSFKLPNGTFIPKHSKLIAHVKDARARSKGDPTSQLIVIFDSVHFGDKSLALKGIVQAVFPPPDEAEDPSITGAATTASGGAVSGGGIGTVTNMRVGSEMNSSGNAQLVMTPESVGVQGIQDLQLEKSGVLTSSGQHIKLSKGVRMIVRAAIFG